MSDTDGGKLAEALRMAIANIGKIRCAIRVEPVASEPWASITFCGERHRLRLSFDGEGAVGAAADLLARLHDLEVALTGEILADLSLLTESRRDDGAHASLDLEALTIDDDDLSPLPSGERVG